MITRRNIVLGAGAFAAVGLMGTGSLRAQQYPSRLLKIVIANPPGGDDDTLSRAIVDQMTGEFGQTIVVENRGGASTTIGSRLVAQSAPDGYTILCVHMASIIQTVLRENLDYGLKSFTPIIGIGGYPMALVVSPKSPIKTFDELKAATSKGDGVSYASGGPGTLAHLTAVRFLNAIHGKGLHIPYKNNPDALQGLAGGFTDIMFPSAREGANLSKAGLIRVLAVTSKERLPSLPDIPTMTELGLPEVDSRLWYSYVAPAGTPPEIVTKLGDLIEKAVKSPKFAERFGPLAFQNDVLRGEPLTQYMSSQADRFRQLIVENNIKVTD
jgi:tripartite-type tricarboxylate transporter receptor subunit TctC